MRYLILLSALGAAIAAYIGFWFYVSGQWRDGVAAWVAAREAEGAETGYAAVATSGFPFRVITTVAEPRLALPGNERRPAWEGHEIAILTHPWDPGHVLFRLTGEHVLSLDDGQRRLHYVATAAEALGSYHVVRGGSARRLSIDLHGLDIAEPATRGRLRADRVQIHERPGERPNSALDLAIKLENVRTEGYGDLLDGRTLTLARLEASVRDAVPNLAPPLGPAIVDWSRRGGTLEITALELVWGGVRLQASGTLALDEALRPVGALTASVSGHRELLDAAVSAGEMTEKDARTARPVLDLLAMANGGMLSVPLSLQDGLVFLGPVAVASLSPLFVDDRNPAPASPALPR